MPDIAYVLAEYPVPSQTFVHAELAALRAAGVGVQVVAHRRGPDVRYGPGPDGQSLPVAHVGLDRPETAAALAGYRHLHGHFGDFGVRTLQPLAERAGVPWSVTVHAYDLFRTDAAVRPEEWAALGPRCRKIVAISRFHADFLRQRGVAADRIAVIPNAARLADLLADAPAPPTSLRRILAVGRPVPKKGFAVLVHAWAEARRAVPGLTLEIVGGEGLVAQPPEGLILSPMRPYAEVLAAMAEADLLVAPSVVAPDGDMDGIPTVLVEACALRRPVVTTAVTGIGDLVRDGVNGLVVPPGDASSLAAALVRLAARPAELQRLGAGGPPLAAPHDARRVAGGCSPSSSPPPRPHAHPDHRRLQLREPGRRRHPRRHPHRPARPPARRVVPGHVALPRADPPLPRGRRDRRPRRRRRGAGHRRRRPRRRLRRQLPARPVRAEPQPAPGAHQRLRPRRAALRRVRAEPRPARLRAVPHRRAQRPRRRGLDLRPRRGVGACGARARREHAGARRGRRRRPRRARRSPAPTGRCSA
ncbi:MAG: glycosyltransferase family 4 protein [Myxococcota bacterium]